MDDIWEEPREYYDKNHPRAINDVDKFKKDWVTCVPTSGLLASDKEESLKHCNGTVKFTRRATIKLEYII